jgi:outer membrane murein-binding lipoprotein Lpp
MSVAARRRRERNRQARGVLLTLGKWLVILGIFAGIGYAAHEAGTKLARIEVDRLGTQLAELEQQRAQLTEQNAALRAELQSARALGQQVQRRYDTEVPRGAEATIMAAVRERLSGGLNAERIRQVVRMAEPARRCSGPSVSRRFRIGTVGRNVDDDSTTFAEGMIRVGAAMPAGSEDAARTATVTFAGFGNARTATGLPAEHVFVVNNLELRLTVSESPVRGFAAAVLTTCGVV